MKEIKSKRKSLTYFSRGVKIIADRVMAALLLLLFSPILLVVAIVLQIRMSVPAKIARFLRYLSSAR
jgi:lipopolysaccharide/colanic/teichoic acid biosynthesis glycosyltransferase